MWSLPGPRSFVQDVLNRSEQQHVAAVLPAYLASDAAAVAELESELVIRGHDVRGVLPWSGNGRLAEAVGFEVFGDDGCPVTVSELLRHPSLAGRVIVLNRSALDASHAEEVPEFLRRLEAESRSVPRSDRCSIVVLTDRFGLPAFAGGDRAEVSLANVWYWNRTARWDAAAHLAMLEDRSDSTVLAEVRVETIVEVARWEFAVATRLARDWDGDPALLPEMLADGATERPGPRERLPFTSSPPDPLLADWDSGHVETWHGATAWAPRLGLAADAAATRLVWNAQARVLLPWIETHRALLEASLKRRLGAERYADAVEHVVDQRSPGDVVEIVHLKLVAERLVGKTNPDLVIASRELWVARNALAHLIPLRPAAIDALVRACVKVWP